MKKFPLQANSTLINKNKMYSPISSPIELLYKRIPQKKEKTHLKINLKINMKFSQIT